VLKLASAETVPRCWALTVDSGANGLQQVCPDISSLMVLCTSMVKLSSSETANHQCQKMDTEADMSALVVYCPARTILSVDHMTIHMPARPISTMTEPKAMFVMRSGERTIMSSGSVRD
jgi:hypothetical protein